MTWKNEIESEYKGRKYVVKIYEDGHRTGYVQLTESEFNRLNQDEYVIRCHGGVTFLEHIKDDIFLSDGYWVGFDAAHLNDIPDFDTAKETFDLSEEKVELYLQLSFHREGTIKTKEYMENECRDIIDQLVDRSW